MGKKKKNGLLARLLVVILFCAGISFLAYPVISNMHNQWQNAQHQAEYDRVIKAQSANESRKLWKNAQAYNEEHTYNTSVDIFGENKKAADTDRYQYRKMLNPTGDGMMGYIEIPKINIMLSVFHGTSNEVLEKGVGHLAGTSLPVGGDNSHCVLAAHRGLPSAKLFTDLDQIEKGDKFYLHMIDHTLAYQIDQIKIIKPKQLEDELAIISGDDLVTLLTCTPYGVNTHRLLVRGHRISMDSHKKINPLRKYIRYGVLATIIVFLIGVKWYVWKKRKKRKTK
ncbi:class C sortase [Hornefia porci]|uniref:Class C sortase n=1 Tax=Hornefia porci TaxID=2652292 RepID=A0A1Q9JFR2_9FIRM|nr:class C sortase [Hornefia porci]OLR55076.1 class C sortase [Hornefia porci]